MATDNHNTQDAATQETDERAEELLARVTAVGEDISRIEKQSSAYLDEVAMDVESSVGAIEETLLELDALEERAGDELDISILQEVEASVGREQ